MHTVLHTLLPGKLHTGGGDRSEPDHRDGEGATDDGACVASRAVRGVEGLERRRRNPCPADRGQGSAASGGGQLEGSRSLPSSWRTSPSAMSGSMRSGRRKPRAAARRA
jgi:hypothetical protein